MEIDIEKKGEFVLCDSRVGTPFLNNVTGLVIIMRATIILLILISSVWSELTWGNYLGNTSKEERIALHFSLSAIISYSTSYILEVSDSDQSLSYIRCTIGDSSFLIRTPFRKFLPSLLVGVGANGLKEWIDYSVGFEADEKDFLFGSLGALLGSSIHLVQDLLLDKSRERKIEIEPTLQGIQFNIGIPYTFNKCIKNIEDTSQVSALNINQEEYSRVMKNEEELEKFYKELKFIYEEIYEIERYMKILSKPYPAPTIDTTVIKELLGINPKNK